MARSKNRDLSSATGLVLLALVVASWLAEQPRWAQVLMTVSVTVTALGWWSLFSRPTSCGVANVSNPRPCGNPVKGIFTACWRPEHKARKRKLIWARLLGRPGALTPQPRPSGRQPTRSGRAGADPAAAESGPITAAGGYWVEGVTAQAITLAFTVLGGLGGVAGVISTVHALTTGGSG